MARRNSSSDAASLDSLLDTLTNVVGILIIILAGLQLDVATQVRRVQGVDPSITESAVAKDREKARLLAEQRAQLTKEAEEADPATIESRIDEMLARIAELKKETESPADKKKIDLAEIEKEIVALKEKVEQSEEELRTTEDGIAEKRARLEEIRPMKEPPPKIVRLPNPRAPEAGLTPVLFVCKDNRVSVIDTDAAIAAVVEVLKRNAQTKPGECDCEKAVRVFEKEKMGNDEFRLSIRESGKIPYLVIEHIPDKGTLPRQTRRSNSPFGQALARMNPSKQYARFLVWPDSYEAYLAARNECDERQIPAGWQPFAEKSEWLHSLAGHFKCEGWVEPPPAKPAPVPGDPGKPPPPPDTID